MVAWGPTSPELPLLVSRAGAGCQPLASCRRVPCCSCDDETVKNYREVRTCTRDEIRALPVPRGTCWGSATSLLSKWGPRGLRAP